MAWHDQTIASYGTDKNLDLLKSMYRSNELLTKRPANIFESISRRNEYLTEVFNRDKALGPLHGGYIPLDEDGNALPAGSKYYDMHLGKMAIVDNSGKVIVTNDDHIDEQCKMDDEFEEKVDALMERCIKSDQICATILNVSVDQLKTDLGVNGISRTMENEELEDTIKNANGTPNSLRATAPGSQSYLNKLAKLRAYVRIRLPYVNLVSFNRKVSDKNDPNVRDPFVPNSERQAEMDRAVNRVLDARAPVQ